jgi:spore coat polysaccharide biosynthesis protein SpsF (cytidylyltransferase family)
VTPFIRTNRRLFDIAEVSAPPSLMRPALRLTVDTRDDLDHLRKLFFRTHSDDPSLSALIAASGPREPLYSTVRRTTIRREVA